jgi:hypothetical protein
MSYVYLTGSLFRGAVYVFKKDKLIHKKKNLVQYLSRPTIKTCHTLTYFSAFWDILLFIN